MKPQLAMPNVMGKEMKERVRLAQFTAALSLPETAEDMGLEFERGADGAPLPADVSSANADASYFATVTSAMLTMAAYNIFFASQDKLRRTNILQVAKEIERTFEVAWVRLDAFKLRPEGQDLPLIIRRHIASYFVAVGTAVDPDFLEVLRKATINCPTTLPPTDENYLISKVFALLMADSETQAQWHQARLAVERDAKKAKQALMRKRLKNKRKSKEDKA